MTTMNPFGSAPVGYRLQTATGATKVAAFDAGSRATLPTLRFVGKQPRYEQGAVTVGRR